MNRNISTSIRFVTAALALLVAVGCSNGEPPDATVEVTEPAPSEAKPLPGPAREMALADTGKYPATVGQAMDYAIYRGFYEALSPMAIKPGGSVNNHNYDPSAETRDKGTLLTVFFTGNVHGEREDCGCKKNPMGGLTRKAHLLTAAANKSGHVMEQPDAMLVLDAGNLLFKAPTVRRLDGKGREAVVVEAEAIVESLNAMQTDAVLIGLYEVAMGRKALDGLIKKARFPFISANLRAKGSEALYAKPYVTVSAAGKKVLIIGVTDPEGSKDYYDKAGFEVADPAKALLAQEKAIAAEAPDLVVLLSNLGVNRTDTLLKDPALARIGVSASYVSGTKRSTYTPHWSQRVPIFEPGSRGKHLGRTDFHIIDGEFVFEGGASDHSKTALRYLNGYRSLHNARRSLEMMRRRAREGNTKGDVPVKVEPARLERMEKSVTMSAERLAKVEAELPAAVEVAKKDAAPAAKSWMRVNIAPLPVSMPQDPKIRGILDKHQARADALRGVLAKRGEKKKKK